jgi:hypothetical protein
MKISILAPSALMVCALAACGGGGGGGDSEAAAPGKETQANADLSKYLGTWERCWDEHGESMLYRVRVLSIEGDTVTVDVDAIDYEVPGCVGHVDIDETVHVKMKLAGGTKTLQAQQREIREPTRGATDRPIDLPERTYEKATISYVGYTLRIGTFEGTLPLPGTTANFLMTLSADGKQAFFASGSRGPDGYGRLHGKFAFNKKP